MNKMETNRDCDNMKRPSESESATSSASSKSSNNTVIPMEGNSVDSLQTDDGDKFYKRPARPAAPRDFKTTLQYNDLEDHLNQRAHSIGIGLFNTDEIDDLPPRHREKVKKVYKKIVDFANVVLPPEVLKTSHGGPLQVSDLLNLEVPRTAERSRNDSEAGNSRSFSRSSSHRSDVSERDVAGFARIVNQSVAGNSSSFSRSRTSSHRSNVSDRDVPSSSGIVNQCVAGNSPSFSRSRTSSHRSNDPFRDAPSLVRTRNHSGDGRNKSKSKATEKFSGKREIPKRSFSAERNPRADNKPSGCKSAQLSRGGSIESLNSTTSKKWNQKSRPYLQGGGSTDFKGNSNRNEDKSVNKNNSSSKKNKRDERDSEPIVFHNTNYKSNRQKKESSNEVVFSENDLNDDPRNYPSSSSNFNSKDSSKYANSKPNQRGTSNSSGRPVFDEKNVASDACDKFDNPSRKVVHNEKPSEISQTAKNERRPNYKNQEVKSLEFVNSGKNKFDKSCKKDQNSNHNFRSRGSDESLNSLASRKSSDEQHRPGPCNEGGSNRQNNPNKNRRETEYFSQKQDHSKDLDTDDKWNSEGSKSKEVSKKQNGIRKNEGNYRGRGKNQRSNFGEREDSLESFNSSSSKNSKYQEIQPEKELEDERNIRKYSSSDSISDKSKPLPRNQKPPFKKDKHHLNSSEFVFSEKPYNNSSTPVNKNNASSDKFQGPKGGKNTKSNLHDANSYESLNSKTSEKLSNESRSKSRTNFENKNRNDSRKHSRFKDEISNDNFHSEKNESTSKQNGSVHNSSDEMNSRPQVRGERQDKSDEKWGGRSGSISEDTSSNEHNKGRNGRSNFCQSASLESLGSRTDTISDYESTSKENGNVHNSSEIVSRPQGKGGRRNRGNKKWEGRSESISEDISSNEHGKGKSSRSNFASLESLGPRTDKTSDSSNGNFQKGSSLPFKKSRDTFRQNIFDEDIQLQSFIPNGNSKLSNEGMNKRQTGSFQSKKLSENRNRNSNCRSSMDSEDSAYSDQNAGRSETKRTQKKVLASSDPAVLQHVMSVVESELNERKDERIDPEKEIKRWEDRGFFVNVNVSENSTSLEFWNKFFSDALNTGAFSLDYCCKFTESLILNFERKEAALKAVIHLKKLKRKTKDLREPHLICVAKLKTRLVRPCNCEKTIVSGCLEYFQDFSRKYGEEHIVKIQDVRNELKRISKQKNSGDHVITLKESLYTLESMLSVFRKQCHALKEEVESSKLRSSSIQEVRLLKKRFSQECNSFQRGLPIYSEKLNILEAVRFHSVSIVIADTGSGKSTQLAEYLLGPRYENGTIICTQPRKIAAISITNYVCGQLGCGVGKLVGYDVGIEKKYGDDTKIIYMTDYALLKRILRDRRLKGVSHVIIDEAHERTLYTDLLIGLLKECVDKVPRLRVIITSATIDPAVFVKFFNLSDKALIEVPGRTYPVKEIWLEKSVEIGWDYVEACVKTAVKIHTQEGKGDILVFLTSPSEIDESIIMFKELCPENRTPVLLSLHGKTDLQEQLLIFDTKSTSERKVIFATNAAETSLTIPGIKYVVDSGMAKELMYYPDKNKSCLMVTFINKSSAEQRKGRAGRTQPGVCYRMYSKQNYQEMPERSTPEILKTNLSKALLKIYEFGIKPERFQFIETPPEESIAKALDSLEQLGLVKDEELTNLGKQVVKLPIDPRLSKLVLLGVKAGIGFEMAIISALVSEAGRLFLRFEDNKAEADKKKLEFCQKTGDFCTFLEVYKRWMEVKRHDRYNWCVGNYINSRALNSALKTMNEIFTCLHQDLRVTVSRNYNNAAFNTHFESIVFTCFSENICIYSGHPKLGYSSPYFTESLYLHPSSALKYMKKDFPDFLVYSTLMQTTRNFIMDVTPIKKATLDQAYKRGTFKLPVDMVKCFQITPKVLGPFGESILVRHILGRGGSKKQHLELAVERLTRSRNFKIDVFVEKGLIVIYVDTRFHDAVSKLISDMVEGIYTKMAKMEDLIKISPFSNACIGSAGRISEVIMPGEYRELVFESVHKSNLNRVEESLRKHGDLLSFQVTESKNSFSRITATYKRVLDAQSAMRELAGQKAFSVKPHGYVEETVKSPLFRLRVSWCRSLSTGSGFIEFDSEADKVIASGRLTNTPVCVKDHSIGFKPSTLSDKELEMTNLPAVVDEEMILEEITDVVRDYVKVKNINIRRRKSPQVSEKDLEEVKKQLNAKFSLFTPSNELVVDVTYPDPKSNVWSAMVYFKNRRELEEALSKLENNIFINSFPAVIQEVAEFRVSYKKDLFEALQSHICNELKRTKGSKLNVETLPDDSLVNLKISCKSTRDLETLRTRLIKVLMGRTVECFGQKKFSFLFNTLSGERFISGISEETHTYINLDSYKMTVNIYGLSENCSKAEELICSRIGSQKLNTSGKRTFDLKNSDLPSGFLKCLYEKYGLNLQNLVKEYKLDDVVLNLQKSSLTLYGSKKQLKLVEDCLEKICYSLFEAQKASKGEDDKDTCAICLSTVPFDYYRLENCGHAFCKTCLLLQVKSSPVPVVCVHEDCGKDIYLVDIKGILALGDDHTKKSFYNSALQHFVNTNIGKITYCPSPGCNMICRVSTSSPEFHCPECNSDICTQCQTLYHYGMSCEMFKNFAEDEDYSLKIWMQENSDHVNHCPKCNFVIEKTMGCNHMECFNCHSHFCWLCLKLFPEGRLVYDHLPFCPKNQGAED